jgi:hypothetical protein
MLATIGVALSRQNENDYLSICKGALGMLMEGDHEVPKLAVGKGTVGIHSGSLQDLGVHLAQPPFQVIQQHLDC